MVLVVVVVLSILCFLRPLDHRPGDLDAVRGLAHRDSGPDADAGAVEEVLIIIIIIIIIITIIKVIIIMITIFIIIVSNSNNNNSNNNTTSKHNNHTSSSNNTFIEVPSGQDLHGGVAMAFLDGPFVEAALAGKVHDDAVRAYYYYYYYY